MTDIALKTATRISLLVLWKTVAIAVIAVIDFNFLEYKQGHDCNVCVVGFLETYVVFERNLN